MFTLNLLYYCMWTILLCLLRQKFANVCDKWKLDINYNKTKVLGFGDRGNRQRNIFLRNNRIEVLNEFKFEFYFYFIYISSIYMFILYV